MRRIPESEIETEFERQYAWGDDERHFYNPNRRKASVMGLFLRLQTVIEQVERFCRPGARVADMASAQGNFGLLLSEKGFDVVAVDINSDFLNYAKKKHTQGKFTTVQSNIMDFRDPGGFDCILLGEIIEHVAHPDRLLKAAYENLRPGGILVLTTPNGDEYGQPLPTYKQVTNLEELIPRQFHWGDHLFLYTLDELQGLFDQQGMKIVHWIKMNSSFTSQIKGLRYLLPLSLLKWMEKKTRRLKSHGKDSTNSLVVVGQKPGP